MWVVPRLPRIWADPSDPPPDYSSLARPGEAVVLAAIVAVAGLALWRLPPLWFPMWFGYLGAGAALAWVDLRTTWLPRRLHWITTAQVALGAVVTTILLPEALPRILLGAAATFALLWLVWRFTGNFGFGDVRLGLLVGAVGGTRGWTGWLWALLAGTLIGAAWGIAHALRGRADEPFPYGPALWLGPLAVAVLHC
uniref:prepilin peptidase n=1 Tax=Arachnia propionica TaxID=1750 RepID=UPI0030C66CB8